MNDDDAYLCFMSSCISHAKTHIYCFMTDNKISDSPEFLQIIIEGT